MWLIDKLAERQIQEAQQRGEVDDLPGTGRPLPAERDAMVPSELRSAYRLLKNAGYLPPEVNLRGQIAEVEQLLTQAQTAEDRASCSKRLRLLVSRLNQAAASPSSMLTEQAYFEQLARKLQRSRSGPGTDA